MDNASECRGLRMWDEEYFNDQNMARERWGASADPQLVLYIPEPATMILLGLGGLGMLIRRKR